MSYLFLIIAFLIAVVDWIAVARGNKKLEYFAKPGVMVALLVWLWQFSAAHSPAAPGAVHLLWFAAGLVFSLAGDVFLMLPREQFIAGLVSFLLGHLAYVVGFNAVVFNASPPPVNPASLVVALLVAVVAVQIYRRIAAGLSASGKGKLKGPVLVYTLVISLMVLSALLTLVRPDEEWQVVPALLAAAGALLFFLSDTFLAWNKFVAPLPYGRLRVIITYHLGQILIALGAALHFL